MFISARFGPCGRNMSVGVYHEGQIGTAGVHSCVGLVPRAAFAGQGCLEEIR